MSKNREIDLPPPSGGVPQQALQRATWLAATVGAFNPAEIVGRVTSELAAGRTLAAKLAPLCSEVVASAGMLWNLAPDPRRRALAQMHQSGVLTKAELPRFVQELKPIAEDHFGQHLREALVGEPNPAAADAGDVDAVYAAYEFVGRAGVGADPDKARESAVIVEQQAQRAAADRRLAQTIGPLFVGREQELAALGQFALTGEIDAAPFATPQLRFHGRVPLAFITGIGGSGKSALLAKLVQSMRRSDSGVAATAILDFDRPTLASFDTLELTLELIRQISLSHPRLAKDLIRLRQDVLDQFTSLELGSNNAAQRYGTDTRAVYSLIRDLGAVVRSAGISDEPFLLILDTFEEVLTLGSSFVIAIYDWLDDLRSGASLAKLHVIVSGRATPADLRTAEQASGTAVLEDASSPAEMLNANVVGAIPLQNLDPSEARDLLERRGVEPTAATELVELFGTNPLVLRLLGDYAEQQGLEEVRNLVSDADKRARYRSEVAQRVLYSRILGRIRADDRAVRELASPGLVVRVVTPGVIENVLAEPCGLGPIDNARAAELFGKLARHIWLVRRIGERAVSHRRDMRTVMLPLVSEPRSGEDAATLRRRVTEIHRRAASYFATADDPDLSAEAQRNEARYHEIFVAPVRAFESKQLRAALPSLAVDLADFPPEQRARLKRLLGRTLSAEEIQSLSAEEGAEYAQQRELQQVRRTGSAHTMREAPRGQQTARPGGVTTEPRARPLTESKIVAAYAAARFEDVAAVCADTLHKLIERVSTKSRAEIDADIAAHPTWLAALSTLSPPYAKRFKAIDVVPELCEHIQQRWTALATQELRDKSGLTVADYLVAVVTLLGRDGSCDEELGGLVGKLSERPRGGRRQFAITSTGALRVFQLLRGALRNGGGLAPTAVAVPTLQYFAALLDRKYVDTLHPAMHAAQRAWRAKIEAFEPVHEALKTSLLHGSATTFEVDEVERSLNDLRFDLYGPQARAATAKQDGKTSKLNALPWPALRGLSPDLQAPMLAGLRERFRDPDERERVLRRLVKCSRSWPTDLGPQALKRGERVRDTFLTTLCHVADRFGATPLLFEKAPARSIAARVGRIYEGYDQIFSAAGRRGRERRPTEATS